MSDFFYKPQGAVAADFIPFYDNGAFRLFYLLDWRDRERHGEGTPWFRIDTTDFVHFTERGQMLARGTEAEQDLYVFTGCVLKAQDGYHIFYTGHNPHLRQKGLPEQAVMHAVSDELTHWRKVPEHTFFAPADRYEPHDWRDPFVFWNDEAGEWWMLLAARLKGGPSRRRGCTALCASPDLIHWEVREPLWAPGLYFTHECPDLFRLGDWWYLVFSEFSERSVTRYRMSRSLSGPWLAPNEDTFDGRAYYAAKSTSDGTRRYLFGWNPTREGNTDAGRWQWGGSLVVHEIVQEADGALSVRPPDTVGAVHTQPAPAVFNRGLGAWTPGADGVRLEAPSSFACASAGLQPDRCLIEATLTLTPGTHSGGLMLCADADFEAAYYVRLEPNRRRLVFDRWPRPGDAAFAVELERPLDFPARIPVRLRVFIEGTVCVVYVNDRIAMNTRLYDHPTGQWGAFVQDGTLSLTDVTLATRS